MSAVEELLEQERSEVARQKPEKTYKYYSETVTGCAWRLNAWKADGLEKLFG